MRKEKLFAGIVAALLVTSGHQGAWAGEVGAWSSRVQLVYWPQTRQVERRTLRAWDTEPAKNLEFSFEPQPGATIAPDGTINGPGKLTWRVRGSASYDPKSIFSTYIGMLRDGRPDGMGKLTLRSGAWFEGTFARGLLEGQGVSVDATGNRYEGMFAAGLPEGKGGLAEVNGTIYTGPFKAGLRHGTGETRLPGGAVYTSNWAMGTESGRPAVLADVTLGGLVRAQAGGGDAGKVELAVAIDQRMTQETEENMGVAYQQMVRDEDVAIFPLDGEMNDLWNGTGEINSESANVFLDRDWDYAPAFVNVDLSTSDGTRVKLDKLELDVSTSQAYRKPMLAIEEHLGCIGFRPSFSVKNYGWGEVRDLKLSLYFTGPNEGGPTSRSFSRSFPTFDQGTDIGIRDVFGEAGVDTAALDKERFSCPSADSMQVCRSQALNKLKLGEVADFVWDNTDIVYDMPEADEGEEEFEPYVEQARGQFFTTAAGTFDYDWADDRGNVFHASEAFSADIPLFFIDAGEQAECGAGFGGSPEAARYQDVRFKINEDGYAIPLTVRGNRNVSSFTARLKMQSEPSMSSYHQFQVAATLGDGSVRKSKPVTFFFMKPRTPEFTSTMMPSAEACYLPQGVTGCSEIDPRGFEEFPEGEEEAQ